jgi:hypothetical protein
MTTVRFTLVGVTTSIAIVLAAGCSAHSSPLYRPATASPTCRYDLRDGEIKMTTRWTGAADEVPDVRGIVCAGGQITCWIETSKGRREGHVAEADWNALWARLEPVSPWAQTQPTVKPNDPTGGPYHVIELRAGDQFSQFSSQHRADILVFTSREAADRLQYSNLIVDFVSCRARTRVELAPAVPESRAGAQP